MVAPDLRIILAVNTFHSPSIAGPNMLSEAATEPEGNSAISPFFSRCAIASARISSILVCASGSCGNGTGIM
jgi:hypothetical protein